MNFLAHLLLADATPASRVGNLLPDLHRGRLPPDLPPAVTAGVIRHRRVDAYTDRHPVFERSRARLRPHHGRYSGILVDVFYDHVLAMHWKDYCDQPLSEFIRGVYHDLTHFDHPLPPRVTLILHLMAEENWLETNRSLEGIALTLHRMSARLRERFGREVDLASATRDLDEQFSAFARDFEVFFPAVRAYVDTSP